MRKAVLVVLALVGCGPLTPPQPDAGSIDGGSSFDAAVPMDAGIADAGIADAGVADAGVADAGIADAGIADAGIADAGIGDAGIGDAGVPDAGLDGGGAVDAGLDAGSTVDAGPCDGGFCRPEKITGELIDPWDLAVDGTSLYWLEYGLATNGLDGQLMRQPKNTVCLKRDGGCAVDLNTQFFGRFRVDSMTLAGSELCWTENYANARDVVCQSVVTNAERFVARNQALATEPIAVGGDLLWVNYGTSAAAQDGQVMRKALNLGSTVLPTPIASLRRAPNSVAVAPGHSRGRRPGSPSMRAQSQPSPWTVARSSSSRPVSERRSRSSRAAARCTG